MPTTHHVWRVCITGLWFALLGTIPTFLRIHVETLRVLPSVLRSLDLSGLPIPDTLAWSPVFVRWISAVGSSASYGQPLLPIVYATLLLIALRAALPSVSLRLWNTASARRLVVVLATWLLVEGAGAWLLWTREGLTMRGLMLIAGFVCVSSALLLSEDGVTGIRLPWRGRSSAWSWARLAIGGLGCGLTGAIVLQFTSFDFGSALYRFMFDFPTPFAPPAGAQGLADFNPDGWVTFAFISLAIAAVGSFCWGSLWTAVVMPLQNYHQRTQALAAAVVPLAMATSTGVWLFYGVVIQRMDYGRSLVQMAEREGIPFGSAGMDTVLIPLADGSIRVARIPFQTILGFPNEPGVTYKVEQYLRTRRYQTTLSRLLFVHLHDVRSIDWDPLRSLEVDRLCLERAPRLQFVQLMVETLSNCAVTPDAKRYLDWLDAKTRPFRQSQGACQTMGNLHARFGNEAKAQEWYQRGEIPEELQTHVVRTGRIVGRVIWNGERMGGVRIGVVSREDALPFTRRRGNIDQDVLVARPFDWRVVAAVVVTDEAGRFELPPLPYGEYVLLLRFEARRLPPTPGSVEVEGLPSLVRLDAPTKDVGSIRVNQTRRRPSRPGRAI